MVLMYNEGDGLRGENNSGQPRPKALFVKSKGLSEAKCVFPHFD